MYGAFRDYTGPVHYGEDLYKMIMRANPVKFPAYWPVTDRYSYLKHIQFGGSQDGYYVNPYAEMVKGYRDQTNSLMMAQLELKHDLSWLTEGLNFRVMANTNRRSDYGIQRFYNPFYYGMQSYNKVTGDLFLHVLNERENEMGYAVGRESLDYNETRKEISSTLYVESAINYNRRFGNHGISGMLVMLMQEGLEANAGSLELSLPQRNLGFSGRATYSLKDRYFTEFNFGYNGSERFSEANRFGFFPSGGVAWQVSNEKFWEPIERYIQDFKLKATYGMVGNDAIGSALDRFFYLSRVLIGSTANGARFGTDWGYSNTGVDVSRYANPEVTWEVAYKTNYGFEMKAFQSLNVQLDIFNEYRKNILMSRAYIPKYLGLEADVKANIGEYSSKGFDMSIDYSHNFSDNFWMAARGNFTYATGQYEKYEEPEYDKEYWKSRVGTSSNQVFGYIAERLFVDDEEVANSPKQFGEVRGGDIKYRDLNGDGVITELDQVAIGNSTVPEVIYGFGFSMGYKKLDLSMFFQGSAQESFWINPTSTAPFYNNQQLLKAYADSYWSDTNGDIMALWPRLSSTLNTNNTQTSTWFMRDGSYLRLKTVEIGYSLPRSLTERIGIKVLRVYGTGQNLLTFSKFKLWDIEMAGNGLGYPIQKIYNFGVQVSF
jgi:TonB-linked SusC/RagA family outer membrane protein